MLARRAVLRRAVPSRPVMALLMLRMRAMPRTLIHEK